VRWVFELPFLGILNDSFSIVCVAYFSNGKIVMKYLLEIHLKCWHSCASYNDSEYIRDDSRACRNLWVHK
jgi:hypothetical protein